MEHSHNSGRALTALGGACENSRTTFDIWLPHRTPMAPDGTSNLPFPCRACHNRHFEYHSCDPHRSAERIVILIGHPVRDIQLGLDLRTSLLQPRRQKSHSQQDYVNLCALTGISRGSVHDTGVPFTESPGGSQIAEFTHT
jgi:hypothetical protein